MSDEIVWQVINQQFCSYKLKCVFISNRWGFNPQILVSPFCIDKKKNTYLRLIILTLPT